jgi:hypothetical protein
MTSCLIDHLTVPDGIPEPDDPEHLQLTAARWAREIRAALAP